SPYPVRRARLLALRDTRRIECAADDLVPNAREILHPAAPNQHHGVLLEVVSLAGDVAGDLHAVGEPDTRHLAKGGVRLLRRRRVDACADAAALGRGDPALAALAGLEPRRGDLLQRPVSALPDELARRRHGGEWYRPALA